MAAPDDLLSLSFQEIQELEQEIGLKEFQRRYGEVISNTARQSIRRPVDDEDDDDDDSLAQEKTKAKKMKKTEKKRTAEKWEPVEISSKIKPKGFSTSMKQSQKTTKIRDPRFDDTSGTFDKELFEKGYGFLKDLKAEDERSLKKFIKTSTSRDGEDSEQVEEAKRKLKAIKRASREETKEKKVDEKLKSMKKAELAAVKEGKKPFFLKKSERKKLTLAEKFKELKQSGKLEKYMEKKRKRNAAKLKKALPSSD